MPGRIKADVVAAVKERTSIEDVVREHVTLRTGGVGSLKGLCPFHDEKSPSFNVRPQLGVWHCFGCGEGGDVLSFVQKVDHLTFAEAVERLAERAGVPVEYEEGGGPRPREEVGRRTRLVEANRTAEEFYAEQLANSSEALPGRTFLAERGFDREAAARFTVGYAPRSGEALLRHLRGRGFTDDEIVLAGLAGRGSRGPYDRFRGRLIWPIRDITGDCVGFGARRLYDDDRIEAKYLNTSDTPLFKKSQVLYGLDLAKKAISTSRRAVVVEGYTDVMACHLAGVDTAVATCGTAFGTDHIKVVRRIMRDDDEVNPAEVVFTFDGDAAGQKAALRAFGEDQRFVSQTYVAVEPHGLDPCELRQQHGDEAVRELIARKAPLFEFAITTTIGRFNLDTAEGRVQALRAAAPVVARIKDRTLRPEYARRLAGFVGLDVEEARRAVAAVGRADEAAGRRPIPVAARPPADPDPSAPAVEPVLPRPDPRHPDVSRERQLLQCVLQAPWVLDAAEFDALGDDAFVAPMHQVVHAAVRQLGGLKIAGAGWHEQVAAQVPDAVRPYVTELTVSPLPVVGDDGLARLGVSLQIDLAQRDLLRREKEVHSRMQRLDAAGDAVGYMAALREAQVLVERRRALASRAD
ncbi:DNA primase [Angustibacter sp. Root456]|uniref:DNA primase n=1 Tax=Angustibacter sp. Root456 TaxID=1736539 RepID=UPI0006FC362C|nr:DNA primase [Angustibacter sp. Root456]